MCPEWCICHVAGFRGFLGWFPWGSSGLTTQEVSTCKGVPTGWHPSAHCKIDFPVDMRPVGPTNASAVIMLTVIMYQPVCLLLCISRFVGRTRGCAQLSVCFVCLLSINSLNLIQYMMHMANLYQDRAGPGSSPCTTPQHTAHQAVDSTDDYMYILPCTHLLGAADPYEAWAVRYAMTSRYS